MYKTMLKAIAVALIPIATSCQMSTMEATEQGHQLSKLPWGLGGMKEAVISPGTTDFYPMWVDTYALDTGVFSISWAGRGGGDNPGVNDAVNTRAIDGNEVFLDLTIQYHVDPMFTETTLYKVGYREDDIRRLVVNWGRSVARTGLGMMLTNEYYNNERRYEAIAFTKAQLNRDLNPFGVVVDNVIFDDHHFTEDYQGLIDSAKQAEQEAQEQENLVATTEAYWKQQFQEAQGLSNKTIALAEGEATQIRRDADAYYSAKASEAKAIETAGLNRVKGIEAEIEALQAEGSADLVKLAFGKSLLESNATFITLPSGGGNGQVQWMDLNQLMSSVGLMSVAGQSPIQRGSASASSPSESPSVSANTVREEFDPSQESETFNNEMDALMDRVMKSAAKPVTSDARKGKAPAKAGAKNSPADVRKALRDRGL
jgi:regulator of protease activity HflC (stomatin/prohibitin superfamily)